MLKRTKSFRELEAKNEKKGNDNAASLWKARERRKSRSLDDEAFAEVRGRYQAANMKSCSEQELLKKQQSDLVLKELQARIGICEYTSLEKINEEKRQRPLKFPVEEVEIRHKTDLASRTNRSITVHGFSSRFIPARLRIEIRGVGKISTATMCKKLKNQSVCLDHNRIIIINEKEDTEENFIEDIEINQFKPISKKEILLMDSTEGSTCKLHFDNTKDAATALMELNAVFGKPRERSNSFDNNRIEEKNQIKYKLLKLLGKRSSKDQLEKKGILKNEPIFGNTLEHLYEKTKLAVPVFVSRIISIIEKPNNIVSLGLYRASGNLAVIQKIRFHIDKNDLKILEDSKNDIDVLTGTLKLFFRELKEPLVPYKTFEELSKLIDKSLIKVEDKIKNLVENLPDSHRHTLLKLIDHLLKVEQHSEDNKMDIHNLSRVWGPTLIWSPDNCQENLLQNHNNANRTVELLLQVYKKNNCAKKDASLEKALLLELRDNISGRSPNSEDEGVNTLNQCAFKREPKYNLELLSSYTKDRIPEFLTKTIPLIEKNISTEMLYQKNGSLTKADKIKKKVTKISISSLEKQNVHDLTFALKDFFAQLDRPAIPKENLERFIRALDLSDSISKMMATRRSFNVIASPYRETLDYLFQHLLNVTRHQENNRTSTEIIADIWAPLLCPTIDHLRGKEIVKLLLQISDHRTVIKLDPIEDRPPPIVKRKEQHQTSLYRQSVAKQPLSVYENFTPLCNELVRSDVRNEANLLDGESSMRMERLTKL